MSYFARKCLAKDTISKVNDKFHIGKSICNPHEQQKISFQNRDYFNNLKERKE